MSRLLALYYKIVRADIDDGSAAQAEHDRAVAGMGEIPSFTDEDDASDPLLQGPDGADPQASNYVSPADIAALSDFKD